MPARHLRDSQSKVGLRIGEARRSSHGLLSSIALQLSICTAVISILGAVLSSPAAAAVPPGFWGVVPQETPTARQLERLQRGGVESIRIPIIWSAVQPRRNGVENWSSVDALVAGATAAGIEVLPFVVGAPPWAVHSVWVPGSDRTVKAPAHLPIAGAGGAAWTAFLEQAVARYGPNGAFWSENPLLTPRPIRSWQVWNEENFKYFVAQPDPAEYGQLIKISSAAIKAVDPGAKVILGGLFSRPPEAYFKKRRPPEAYFATEFLTQMYEKTPGLGNDFTAVALHPYSATYQEMAVDIEELREVLKVRNEAAKPLWITEMGWSSEPPNATDSFDKGANGQAAQLRGAYQVLEKNQVKWRIQRAYWFAVNDQNESCNFCGGSGLFAPGFKPKKAWYEYVKLAANNH